MKIQWFSLISLWITGYLLVSLLVSTGYSQPVVLGLSLAYGLFWPFPTIVAVRKDDK